MRDVHKIFWDILKWPKRNWAVYFCLIVFFVCLFVYLLLLGFFCCCFLFACFCWVFFHWKLLITKGHLDKWKRTIKDLKKFIINLKGEHSAGKEFHFSRTRKKATDIKILIITGKICNLPEQWTNHQQKLEGELPVSIRWASSKMIQSDK